MQHLFKEGIEVTVITPPPGYAKKNLCSYRQTQKSILKRIIKEMSGKPKMS